MHTHPLFVTVRDFLNNHRKAVFAINDESGLPTTSLMLYVIDDDLNVFFGTRKSYAKYGNITKTPVVSLSVIEEKVDPLKVLDIRGDVEELTLDECTTTLTWFKTKNPAKYYIEDAEDLVMFKLTPHFVRWLDAESGQLETFDLTMED